MAGENYNNRNKNRGKLTLDQLNAQYGKIPPQALEVEEAVLGALMLERDAYIAVADILKPESFYKEEHQKIFKAIQDLSANEKPVDLLMVTQELKNREELEEVGGPLYITQLTSKVASAAHIEFHARIIAQKYIQRELIRISTEIQTKSYDDTMELEDLIDYAEGSLFKVTEGSITKESQPIKPILREAIEQIEENSKKEEGLSGVPSGFTRLDRMTSGWQKTDLMIIAARPAMGKTAFVLSMARNMAVDHHVPVAVFSLEMSSIQLVNRLIAAETELGSEKLKTGRLENWEWEQLNRKIKNLEEASLFIDDTPALSIFEFRAKARRLKMQHNIGIIIVDYLQLMTAGSEGRGSREQEVSTISRNLKAIAKEVDVPIIALSQLNRSVESRDGKRPQLSDLRESGAIEQDADMVMFIHRPEYYGITEDESGNSLIGMAEIIIAKHRNGAVGDVHLAFKSHLARFSDPDEESLGTMPEDLGNGQVGARFSSKMNEDDNDPFEKSLGTQGFPAAGGGLDDETPF
ncbi:replicative DNA helicase [Prolixibacter denitrificans]|uniref:Replicative DNA helicase n=1 Tax=Prolixibacter denitrificans TaxID=1541063 RepID=A0A2P8CKD6_9BACT|nr:replicative DNA helicase [Prolixibacter denitrificans]PSK85430.1 replicative DNA helicase [Prolixibacter denitrificans]GET20051.1 replicative DNA helicase [Prolixibacter denitrificans]